MADFCNNEEDFDFCNNEKDFVLMQLKPRVGEKWREIQGESWWKGLLGPMINPVLKAELLRYGDFAQLCYDSFDDQTNSKYYGSCKHGRETLFQKMGMPNCGYHITKYLYANTAILSSLFAEDNGDITGGGRRVWIGFVAVCTDEDEIRRLGRRDILIAWRGTATPQEWVHDLTDILVPARLSHRTSATTQPDHGHGVRIEKGFLTCYTSSSGSPDGFSARQVVLEEIRRLVEEYEKDEGLSITLTGHSLGGALATLSAYDIAKQSEIVNLRRPSPVTVTVFAFASPRVGNPAFGQQLEDVGVKVLRLVNKQDVVPRVPGILINENFGSMIPRLLNWLPWTYVHVGVQLTLDTNNSPFLKKHRIFTPGNLAHFHNLEVYLHLLDGFVGHDKPYKSIGRDTALVNKSSDFLIARLHIPSYWWQEQNKGLVKDVHGRWTQRSLSYSLSTD